MEEVNKHVGREKEREGNSEGGGNKVETWKFSCLFFPPRNVDLALYIFLASELTNRVQILVPFSQ